MTAPRAFVTGTAVAPAAVLVALWALHRTAVVSRMSRRLSPRPPAAPAAARLRAGLRRVASRADRRRRGAVERQLPEVLALQVGALRAGHSVAGSFGAVAPVAGPPLGPELARCAAALGLGAPLDEALEAFGRRCGPAVGSWVAALLAGTTTGGDLTRTLESLASRARGRAQLRSEVRALTAQGRMSGTVVALAPVGFLALMSLATRHHAAALYASTAGRAALLAGTVLDVAGLLWIRRIVRIGL